MPKEARVSFHERCVRALQPGGVMMLEASTPAPLAQLGVGGPSMEALLMTPDGLREEFAGLEFEHYEEVIREVQEGLYHKGMSATVQNHREKALSASLP